jgi:tetratricopeptide (TPR) repeat protein
MLAGGCASREAARPAGPRGDYQKRLDKQKAGLPVADEALQNLPQMSVKEYEMAGDNYFLQNNLPMAFVQYDKALQMAPATSNLRYKKGLIFLKRGLARDALQEFQEILKADNTFALADEGAGQACLLLGEMRQAEKYLQRAITLDASLWKSHNFLGMLYDYHQRFEDALASYKAAMALKKDEGLLFNNFGVSAYRKGDYENALRAFDKALNMGYVEARVYNNLGLSLAKLGRYQEALLAFTRGGDRAKAYNNLGVIYLTEGKYPEAVAAFQAAMELSPRYYTKANENLRLAQQALNALPRSPAALSMPSEDSDAQAALPLDR